MTNWVAKMKDATLLSSEVLVDKPKRFVRELLRMPDGQEIEWYFADTTPSVMVVPVTEDGDVVLVKQYRHNLKKDTLELPAGIVAADEPTAEAALRELVEETGYVLADSGTVHALGRYYALPSETNKYVHLYLATPVRPNGKAQGDTEIEKYFDMSTVHMPFDEAISEIGGRIDGLETVGALLLAQKTLAGLS